MEWDGMWNSLVWMRWKSVDFFFLLFFFKKKKKFYSYSLLRLSSVVSRIFSSPQLSDPFSTGDQAKTQNMYLTDAWTSSPLYSFDSSEVLLPFCTCTPPYLHFSFPAFIHQPSPNFGNNRFIFLLIYLKSSAFNSFTSSILPIFGSFSHIGGQVGTSARHSFTRCKLNQHFARPFKANQPAS